MWRDFQDPAPLSVIREAVKKSLADVLEVTGQTKTQLSVELFDCPSALTRFMSGTRFSYKRVEALIAGFDRALGVVKADTTEAEE